MSWFDRLLSGGDEVLLNIRKLRSANYYQRRDAIDTLAKIGDKRAIEPLKQLFKVEQDGDNLDPIVYVK